MAAIIHILKLKYLGKLLAHCYHHRYTAGSIIIYTSDRCETLFFVIRGSITIFIEDDDDRGMTIDYLNSGDSFGELGLLEKEGSEQERSIWVCVKVECKIAGIGYTKFRELSQQDSEILYALDSQMADRLCKTTCKVGDLALLNITGRVAHTLLDLCQQPDTMTYSGGMQIEIAHQEVGRIVGCSREMVGRVLKSLEEQGLVHMKERTTVVLGIR